MDGELVQRKAQELLGSHQIRSPDNYDPIAEARATLTTIMEMSSVPILEAAMFREPVYARADALIPNADSYVLSETKAKTFPLKSDKLTPKEPDEHLLDDVAIQAWVAQGQGFKLSRLELNLLNSQWTYPGSGDYSGLFRQLDVTAAALARAPEVGQWAHDALRTISGEMPELETGRHCDDPHPCALLSFCEQFDKPGPEHPIELLPDSAGKGLARKLKEKKGYSSILEPSPDELVGAQSVLYKRMQAAHRDGRAIKESACVELLTSLPYPRYYFDFEGIDLPVPRWSGIRPYEQIPFQWSCHIENSAGQFTHSEFLDLSGDDPSLACIKALISVIDPSNLGPIFVYYATYERGRLEGLRDRHPEFAAQLEGYVTRLVDLHPLVKSNFYDPRMKGSFSIKKVLPVIAPDLDYSLLEEVAEGTGAQNAYLFAALHESTSKERRNELASKLRKYCAMDTWAMVEVAYFLAGLPRPNSPAKLPIA